MAQVQPYRLGFRWVKSLNSPGLGTPPIVRMVVASNNTLAVFAGDAVQQLTGGTVYPNTRGGGSYATLDYVVVSVERYLGSDGIVRKGGFLPAATTYTGTTSLANPLASVVLCIPVLDQVFAATVPTAEATLTAATAKLDKCIDLDPGAGNTTTGISGHLIYTGTDGTYGWQSTTTSGQWRLRQIPTYGITGTLNDPTAANWEGWFTAYELTGIV